VFYHKLLTGVSVTLSRLSSGLVY